MALIYQGTKISPGLGMGQARVVEKLRLEPPAERPREPEQELLRFHRCYDAAEEDLRKTVQEAQEKLGGHEAEILDAQLTLLQDEYSVLEPIQEAIRDEGLNMAQAIDKVLGGIVELFQQAEDEYMRLRAGDAEDVRKRLLMRALGVTPRDYSVLPAGTILVAEELTPSDTIRMDLAHVSGIVTSRGGYYSHVGIISRNLGIPSVCGIPEAAEDGDTVLVDGEKGVVTVNPDEAELALFSERRREAEAEKQRLDVFRTAPSRTLDGEAGLICGNIGTAAEAQAALDAGAEGIGLLRSEFLYMDQPALPDEETQFQAYRQVLETMGGRPVIIRTLDVGGDKAIPALPMEREENPFLGCRAIRLCLERRELFRVQLRALLRAGSYGDLKIMFPMISTLGELRSAKAMLEEARKELLREGVPVRKVPVGIMVEVPAAAVIADCLAREADFFSIGTNDLIQYTMAAERGNPSVDYLYSPYDPAVLRLIAMAAGAAERAGILCGMCGEAAADPELLPVFWGMGLRELSMSPGGIVLSRAVLANWRTEDCRALAERVLSCTHRQEVQAVLKEARTEREALRG